MARSSKILKITNFYKEGRGYIEIHQTSVTIHGNNYSGFIYCLFKKTEKYGSIVYDVLDEELY